MSRYNETVKSIGELAQKHCEKIAIKQDFENVRYDWEKLTNSIKQTDCPWETDELLSIIKIIQNNLREKSEVFIVQTQDQNGVEKCMRLPYYLLIDFYKFQHRKLAGQDYYHKILKVYYNKLSKYLQAKSFKIFSWDDFEFQAGIILPLIKLEEICHIEDETLKTTIHSHRLQFITECPRLNEEDLYQIVTNKYKKKRARDPIIYNITKLNSVDGFLGEYFAIDIKVNTGTTRAFWESMKVFAKFTSRNIFRETSKIGLRKEIFVYNNFVSLLKLHGFDSLADFAPEFYFGRFNDVIVVENMAAVGYKSEQLIEMLTVDHLQLVICQLSKLHASSVMLDDVLWKFTGKRLDEIYTEHFKEIVYVEHLIDFYTVGFEAVEHTIDKLFENIVQNAKGKHMSKEKFKDRLKPEFLEKVKKSHNFHNVLCHGDLHSPNILFKVNDQTRKPTDCKLIDFQNIRYCPPMHDVLFAIYTNTYKNVRDEHMDQLLEKYYSLLAANLEKFDYDIDEVFTAEEFKESCDYQRPQAIIQALLYSHFKRCPKHIKDSFLKSEEEYLHASQVDRRPFIDQAFDSKEFVSIQEGLLFDLYDALYDFPHE